MALRLVRRLVRSQPTLEGAGVHLHRAFGFGDTAEVDPFLLFDDFRGERPLDYQAGFPWHPHRGIETVTYVLAGTVEHGDSLGHKGAIGAGDVQWMTAGSGIIHQEMPQGDAQGRMYGFQLWVNLPAAQKMSEPRYQELKAAEIPVFQDDDGTRVRVVCGRFGDTLGPVAGIAADPTYLDIEVPPLKRRTFPVDPSRHAFAYVFEGDGRFGNLPGPLAAPGDTRALRDEAPPAEVENRWLVLFGDGDEVAVEAGARGIRFLLVSGKPLEQPVAWRGPIVMNTHQELREAFRELQDGTFLRHGKA